MNQVLLDGKAPNFASVSGPSVPADQWSGGKKCINNKRSNVTDNINWNLNY